MILLSDVRNWLESLGVAENYYVGKMDNKKENSIGVYQLKDSSPPRFGLGGYDLSSYEKKGISLLVHWNKNAVETEEKAWEIYQTILHAKDLTIGKHKVQFLTLNTREPVDVDTDDNHIYERVIEFVIYFDKKESEE